jgi:hypothetical protein
MSNFHYVDLLEQGKTEHALAVCGPTCAEVMYFFVTRGPDDVSVFECVFNRVFAKDYLVSSAVDFGKPNLTRFLLERGLLPPEHTIQSAIDRLPFCKTMDEHFRVRQAMRVVSNQIK